MAKTFKKKTFRKGKKTVNGKIKKIEKFMIRNRPEMKFIQASSPYQFLGLTNVNPLNQCLNIMNQGTNEVNNRIGAKANFHFVNIKMRIAIVPGTWPATQGGDVRILLVKEKTTLGSLISLTQYFIDSTGPYTYSQRNYSDRDSNRFHCYYDKTFKIGVGDNTKDQLFHVNIYKKLNFSTNYSRNNLGTVQDIDTNGLSIIVITNQTTSSALNVNWEYVMGFTDA